MTTECGQPNVAGVLSTRLVRDYEPHDVPGDKPPFRMIGGLRADRRHISIIGRTCMNKFELTDDMNVWLLI